MDFLISGQISDLRIIYHSWTVNIMPVCPFLLQDLCISFTFGRRCRHECLSVWQFQTVAIVKCTGLPSLLQAVLRILSISPFLLRLSLLKIFFSRGEHHKLFSAVSKNPFCNECCVVNFFFECFIAEDFGLSVLTLLWPVWLNEKFIDSKNYCFVTLSIFDWKLLRL